MNEKNATTEIPSDQLLTHYADFGYKLVRISRSKKNAVDTGWPELEIPTEDVIRWVKNDGNVAIQAGKVSDWICAADFDCKEAAALAPKFLKPETLKSGKAGVADHWIYRSEGAGYIRIKDMDGKVLVELKASADGAGHYFVVAPSIHPNKGPYQWLPGFNPAAIAEVSPEELEAGIRRLGVATLVVRHLPPEKIKGTGEGGGRHDYAMALAGFLIRNGMSPDDVLNVCSAAWELEDATREAFRDLDGIVHDTARKLESKQPVKGGGTLEKTVPRTARRSGESYGMAAGRAWGTARDRGERKRPSRP